MGVSIPKDQKLQVPNPLLLKLQLRKKRRKKRKKKQQQLQNNNFDLGNRGLFLIGIKVYEHLTETH